jgi:signal peptide peptidase SppA
MTTHQYARIVAEVRDQPWAILPSTLAAITSMLELRAEGITLTEAEIHARIGGPPRERPETTVTDGGVGILQVFGVLSQRMNLIGRASGGTSTEQLTSEFRALRDDPQVRAIVMAFDTPGGSTYGIEELGTEIRAARAVKPIAAVASSVAASAGFWLFAQAGSRYVTPGGDVGSVGVFTVHEDMSGYLAKRGIKPTLIAAGPHKAEDNPFNPLSDEARAALQTRVNGSYDRFLSDLATAYAIPVTQVAETFGGGRLMTAREALAAGMVEEIATLDAVIARYETSSRGLDIDTPHEPLGVTGHDRSIDARQRQALAALSLALSQ